MTPFFEKMKHVSWPKFVIVIGATAIFWGGIGTIVPQKVHTPVLVVLTSLQSGLAFLMRATRYVERTGEVPKPGEQP